MFLRRFRQLFRPAAETLAEASHRPRAPRRGKRRRPASRHGLRLESLEGRDLLATVTNFHLDSDTGASSTDKITNNPTVSATVGWSKPGSARVDFDHNNDAAAEGSVTMPMAYSMFTYNPLAVDSLLNSYSGSFTIKYRVVELGSGGTTGAWESFTMTLDRVAPTVSAFSPAAGSAPLAGITEATATMSEAIQSLAGGEAQVVRTSNGLQPSQTLSQPSSNVLKITFNTSLPNVNHTTSVNTVKDIAGNLINPTASATWRVNAPPVINFSQPADHGHGNYTLYGWVTDDTSVSGLTVTIGDLTTATGTTDANGEFAIEVHITEYGWVTADTVDLDGAASNTAEQLLDDL